MEKKRANIIFTSVVCSMLFVIYYFAFPAYSVLFPKCPFNLITGLLCPGCGSQRALFNVLHGNIVAAAKCNSLLVIGIAATLSYAAYCGVKLIFNLENSNYTLSSGLLLKVAVVIVVLFWTLRNIPGYPFNILAPV